MRIAEDKVTVQPQHSLTKEEVKIILGELPEDWVKDIESVRLSNALPDNSNAFHFAKFSPWKRQLTLAVRALTKEKAVRAILRELASRPMFPGKYWWILSGAESKQVDRRISPLVDLLLPQLSKKKTWMGHPVPEAHDLR